MLPLIRDRAAIARACAGAMALCRIALLGMMLLLMVSAYFPFHWDPPRMVRNDVARSADGALRFGDMNAASTPGTPAWLPKARTSGAIQIQLNFKPQSAQENSPASIMMLASDFWHTDFAITQDQHDLFVWLRRPGSDAGGGPPFAIDGVLRPGQWNSVGVTVQRDDIRIVADGRVRLISRVPADSTRDWSPGRIALGDEVHGGRPWQGEIEQARVGVFGYAADYVRPGALTVPERYLYAPDRIEPFPPTGQQEWLALSLELLSLIPIGFLIVWARRPPVGLVPASLVVAGLAVLITAGKFLFYARHIAVADVICQVIGGVLGALAARWISRSEPPITPMARPLAPRTARSDR